MKKNRFTEERTISILKEHHADLPAADLCRTHGISEMLEAMNSREAAQSSVQMIDSTIVCARQHQSGDL